MKKGKTWIIELMIFLLAAMCAEGCSPSKSVLKIVESEIEDPRGTQDGKEDKKDVQPSPEDDRREETEEDRKASEKEVVQEMIYVEVCGAVCNPGVYQLPSGSRVFEAVKLAGGFREDARSEEINQAEELYDGQQIRIYTVEELQQQEQQPENTQQIRSDGKVDLNRADKALLMTLEGIGETRAEAILAYREKQGRFSTIEELMQVEGIKEKTYEKLKNQITVS